MWFVIYLHPACCDMMEVQFHANAPRAEKVAAGPFQTEEEADIAYEDKRSQY